MGQARTKKSALLLKRESLITATARLWAEKKTKEETAEELGISIRSVGVYRQLIVQRHHKNQAESHGTRILERANELIETIRKASKLHHLNLKKFSESEKPKETITVTKDASGNLESTTIKEEESVGEVKFLTEARKCEELALKANAELRKLFGDNVQADTEGIQTHNHNNTINQTVIIVEDEKWYGNDAHEHVENEHIEHSNGKHNGNGSDSHAPQAAAASVAGVIESSAVQGSSVRPSVGKNGNGAANGH